MDRGDTESNREHVTVGTISTGGPTNTPESLHRDRYESRVPVPRGYGSRGVLLKETTRLRLL